MNFDPIGTVHSCFTQRFGTPRQPGLVKDSTAVIRLKNEQRFRDALKTLESFSHLWVIFQFHDLPEGHTWKPRIRPPRLRGAEDYKVGVLASRSPHRPNPIGLSAVEIARVDVDAPLGPEIHIRNHDIQDQTPVLDIKPYIAYADSIPDANSGWAQDAHWSKLEVEWSPEPLEACLALLPLNPTLKNLVEQTLQADPRPPDYTQKQMLFKTQILDYDVHWQINPPNRCTIVRWINLAGTSGIPSKKTSRPFDPS